MREVSTRSISKPAGPPLAVEFPLKIREKLVHPGRLQVVGHDTQGDQLCTRQLPESSDVAHPLPAAASMVVALVIECDTKAPNAKVGLHDDAAPLIQYWLVDDKFGTSGSEQKKAQSRLFR
jgi:hypothetical protein